MYDEEISKVKKPFLTCPLQSRSRKLLKTDRWEASSFLLPNKKKGRKKRGKLVFLGPSPLAIIAFESKAESNLLLTFSQKKIHFKATLVIFYCTFFCIYTEKSSVPKLGVVTFPQEVSCFSFLLRFPFAPGQDIAI